MREPGPGERVERHGWYIPSFQRQKELDPPFPGPAACHRLRGSDTRTHLAPIVGVGRCPHDCLRTEGALLCYGYTFPLFGGPERPPPMTIGSGDSGPKESRSARVTHYLILALAKRRSGPRRVAKSQRMEQPQRQRHQA